MRRSASSARLLLAAFLAAAPAAAAPLEAPRPVDAIAPVEADAAGLPTALAAPAAAAGLEQPASPQTAPASLPAAAVPAAQAVDAAGSAQAQARPDTAGSLFDGSRPVGAALPLIAAAAATPAASAAGPAAYSLVRYAVERRRASKEPVRERGWRRLGTLAEAHVFVTPALIPAAMIDGLLRGAPALVPLAAAAFAVLVPSAMEDYVGRVRRRVVGGWQASHDQKFRVDPATGKLRDVRGHPIGSDRYEAYADGPVSPGERLWMRALGLALGGAWLHFAAVHGGWLYAGAAAAGLFALDWARDHRPPTPPPTPEDAEHARRFNQP